MRKYFDQASTTSGKVLGLVIDAHLFTGMKLRLDNYLLIDRVFYLTKSNIMKVEETDPRLHLNDQMTLSDIIDFIITNGDYIDIIKYDLDEVYGRVNKYLRTSQRYLHRKYITLGTTEDRKKWSTELFKLKKKLQVIDKWNQTKELSRV